MGNLELTVVLLVGALLCMLVWMICQRLRLADVEKELDKISFEQECAVMHSEYLRGRLDGMKDIVPPGRFGSCTKR